MSWIVQNLWNNREAIKEKSRRDNGISYSFGMMYGSSVELDESRLGYDDPFIESDEFNDLLVIEKAVDDLAQLQLLDEDDLNILYEPGKMHRNTYAKKFCNLCERIAYYLGGYFTDDGYISYLAKKYNLTPEQQQVARVYMRSRFKNKILSKGYRIENNHEENRTVSNEV